MPVPHALNTHPAYCLAPDSFQTLRNVHVALQNLSEQVLDLKAHWYVKPNRYRSLICNLDWGHWKKMGGGGVREEKGRNTEGESCSSSYTFCMQHAELTCSSAPKKTAMESSTTCPKLEEVFALLPVSRNSQTQMMHKLGASQPPSCSNIFLWSCWHPCKMWREFTALRYCWVAGGMLS